MKTKSDELPDEFRVWFTNDRTFCRDAGMVFFSREHAEFHCAFLSGNIEAFRGTTVDEVFGFLREVDMVTAKPEVVLAVNRALEGMMSIIELRHPRVEKLEALAAELRRIIKLRLASLV